VCAGNDHSVGVIGLSAYYAMTKRIVTKHATPTEVPVLLAYNVFEDDSSGCCVAGFHSAFGRSSGTQVFATAAYSDAGLFRSEIEDVAIGTHELGELLNDPFVGNATPAWGHIGQVSGCQSDLEVGDPLTGTEFVHVYHGYAYHPQELAFFSWFFRTHPTGTGGLYSFKGTLKGVEGKCA